MCSCMNNNAKPEIRVAVGDVVEVGQRRTRWLVVAIRKSIFTMQASAGLAPLGLVGCDESDEVWEVSVSRLTRVIP